MRRPSLFELCGITLMVSGVSCAPAPVPTPEPHLPTVAAVRPKLDSIDGRIEFVAERLNARLDSLEHSRPSASATPVHDSEAVPLQSGSEAIGSGGVPEGTIVGVVMDLETGEALEAAQVALRPANLGDISDASGRFEIPRAPLGEFELRAEMVGYTPVSLPIRMDRAEGVVARFLLRPHVWVDCEFVWARHVRVTVRDVVTGLAPATATALRVSNGEERWWALGQAEEAGDALDLVVQVGPGPLDVEVAAEGYEAWYGTAVMPQSEGCTVGGSSEFDVWLLPTEDHTWRR